MHASYIHIDIEHNVFIIYIWMSKVVLHIVYQRCHIQKICKWVTRPILSAMMFSQPVVLGTPFLKVLSIKTKIALNCVILFINFFFILTNLIKGIWLLCVMNVSYTFRKLINLRSCYPFLENSIPFSHQKSCFERERYSSIKIKSRIQKTQCLFLFSQHLSAFISSRLI